MVYVGQPNRSESPIGNRYAVGQPCNNGVEVAASDARRWRKGECQLPQGAAHGDATARSRIMADNIDALEGHAGVVSARMRLLYDYRAPAGTRWSPTAEQLRELLALFHVGGLRTPSTAQISRITARLRVHGRIEGRNVFYWFQNQKARERKRRLQLMQTAPSPLENTTSSMNDAPLSSPQGSRPAEEAQSSMMNLPAHEELQPAAKRCRLIQEASYEADCHMSGRSLAPAASPEEIKCAVPLHQLWSSCQAQQATSDAVPLVVAERERDIVHVQENSGLCMHNLQNVHQACSRIMSNSQKVTRIKHAQFSSVVTQLASCSPMDDMAEDEQSEVSDANVQHCASSFTNFIWRADKVQCTGDEISSVAAVETRMQQAEEVRPGLHHASWELLEAITCPRLPALTLFPLSPTFSSSSPQNNQHRNILGSSMIMHRQNQDVKGTGLSSSNLCMQSSLLDLKLANR